MSLTCPVCLGDEVSRFLTVDRQDYFWCKVCAARFLDPSQRLARADELAHYGHHKNEVDDPAYRAFLARLANPFSSKLATGSAGLDFGCGPGPALAAILHEAGHEVALYDPFFVDDRAVLKRTYDFVTCTETVEHFHDPAREFARFDALLRPGGWLGVMTCFQSDDARFANWHYRMDPTHVVFYREATFRWIAAQYGWQVEVPRKDVVLMQKGGSRICGRAG